MPNNSVIVNTSPLLYLHQVGYLTNVAPVIEKLRNQGMWLTDKIIKDILELAGETY